MNGKRLGPLPRLALLTAISAMLVAGATSASDAATFDLAKRTDGSIIQGLRVEGEIVPGDAQRLLDAYAKYGTEISPIYLRSKGGDVEEAMRMGTIVRRLRLETCSCRQFFPDKMSLLRSMTPSEPRKGLRVPMRSPWMTWTA